MILLMVPCQIGKSLVLKRILREVFKKIGLREIIVRSYLIDVAVFLSANHVQ